MSALDLTLTSPWSPDTHALLTETLSHAVAARVVTSNEVARNLVPNPNLELDSAGWSATTGTFTRDTASPITGTASAKVTGAGGTLIALQYVTPNVKDRPPVEQGTTIEVTLRVKCSVSTQLRLDVGWHDENGTFLSVTTGTGTALATPAANTPVTLKLSPLTVPDGASRAYLACRTVGTVAAGVGLWADLAFVGPVGFSYFDGSSTGALSYRWDGTPNASQSIAYDPTVPDLNVPVSVKSGTVSFDETRSPRAIASNVVCDVPDSQAELTGIDPRTGARLQIDAGYSRPDGLSDVWPLVDLVLRERPVSRPDDTMSLTGHGDESLVIDNSPSAGGSLNAANTVTAMQSIIRMIFPSVALANPSALTGAAVAQTPLGDKHSLLMDLSDRIDAKVYDDGLRNWKVEPTPTLTTPALELKVGDGGTVIDSETTLSRDDWYNRVFLTYDWTDAADVQHKVIAVRSITSGPYATRVGNVRTLELTRNIPATQTEANAAAAALVKRTVTRGRSFVIGAIAAYWLRPGMTVSVTLPLGETEEHLVTAVTFDLAAGKMTVTTRLPDGNYTIGA